MFIKTPRKETVSQVKLLSAGGILYASKYYYVSFKPSAPDESGVSLSLWVHTVAQGDGH